MYRVIPRYLTALFLVVLVTACVRNQPEVVVITATPSGPLVEDQQLGVATGESPDVSLPPQGPLIVPTPDPTRPGTEASTARQHVVQIGDTLSAIATANGTTVETLISLNGLVNPDSIEVGQVILLPGAPSETTSAFKIIPDSRFVLGPGSAQFDIDAFISQQPGYVRTASDQVDGVFLTAAQVIRRVSLEYSVDPRLLLALLEYQSGWLSSTTISEEKIVYPLGAPASVFGFDRSGLYRQAAWAADQLNYAYYGWKLRGLNAIEFSDGVRLAYAPGLNAGTVGIQYLLSLNTTSTEWQLQVEPQGFYQTYVHYFGDPFANAVEPLVPPNLEQPALALPFAADETWYYTGGPHGGWGTGSAWAAIDFAPPDDLATVSSACYVSQHFATAVAPGVIARTDEGTVILDLDGDGDETTGWTILYLHMATEDRIAEGTRVEVGDRIGRPSCEGGFSNGTHMHIARRFNGEWIPASCEACAPGHERPSFVMNGWTAVGLPGQEYQGYLVRGDEQRVAEQGRLDVANRVSA